MDGVEFDDSTRLRRGVALLKRGVCGTVRFAHSNDPSTRPRRVSRLLRMPHYWFAALASLVAMPSLAFSAEAVFSADGGRVWLSQPGLGYIDIDDREGTTAADRMVGLEPMGGPAEVRGVAISKKGNVLLLSSDAVWAFDTKAEKTVHVAALPAAFVSEDLAYQETTGGILVWGSFVREDGTVERSAAYWIARGSDKPAPVLIEGIEGWQAATFDSTGHLYLGRGPDLWGGVLIATEHEKAADFAWQIRAFRIAALGTPIAGEGANAGALIHSIGAGGGRLIITMRGAEGSTMLALPRPLPIRKDGGVDRLLELKDRWAFQQKVIASIALIGAPSSLPLLPIVAINPSGSRIIYQTAGPGVRRWWVIERSGKPRLMSEVSD
jgi:hypothetical protein